VLCFYENVCITGIKSVRGSLKFLTDLTPVIHTFSYFSEPLTYLTPVIHTFSYFSEPLTYLTPVIHTFSYLVNLLNRLEVH
jgi:hypothetical protein